MLTKTESFIKKAKIIHGDKYDYRNSIYVNSKEKVAIICPVHGKYMQPPSRHLSGAGCKKCADQISGKLKRERAGLEFVSRAVKIHGNKYDYSKVKYERSSTKVTVICLEHGKFQVRPNSHLRSSGCPKCGAERGGRKQAKSIKQFILEARAIHGEQYDYSKVTYATTHKHVTIICPQHGPFDQAPSMHLAGQGCPDCGIKKQSESARSTTEEFITEARKIHGDKYDYSRVMHKLIMEPVIIVCPVHGEFQQAWAKHISRRQGCPSCANRNMDTDKFVKRAQQVHGGRYDYSQTEYIAARKEVTVLCSEHGSFTQVAQHHLAGSGCPLCFDLLNSKGSQKIEAWLSKNSIPFEREKTFKDLKNIHHRKYALRFDFYLQRHNLLIEFDGRQHFEPVPLWGGEEAFNRLRDNDHKKAQWANQQGYILLRIAYYDENNISDILSEHIPL